MLQARGAEEVVAGRTRAQAVRQGRRVVEGFTRQAVEPRQPVGHGLRRREELRRLAERPRVPLGQPALYLERGVVHTDVREALVGQLVRAAVLVEEPDHLARVPDEVAGEVGGHHQVGVGGHEAPGERCVEEAVLLPGDRQAHQLGLVAGGSERRDEVLLVLLGAAVDERLLCAAYQDVHCSSSRQDGPNDGSAARVDGPQVSRSLGHHPTSGPRYARAVRLGTARRRPRRPAHLGDAERDVRLCDTGRRPRPVGRRRRSNAPVPIPVHEAYLMTSSVVPASPPPTSDWAELESATAPKGLVGRGARTLVVP